MEGTGQVPTRPLHLTTKSCICFSRTIMFILMSSPSSFLPFDPLGPGELLFFQRFYLFIFRKRGERKRGREMLVSERNIDRVPSVRPDWGPNPQPRHEPTPGIETVTFHSVGRRLTH